MERLDLIDNFVFDYDTNDYPDFADATVVSADYRGIPMSDAQLNTLNDQYSEFVHEKLLEHLY